MGKRKDYKDADLAEEKRRAESSEDDSDSDTDMLNVDFEWFDPQPEHDFHGLKTLLRQLFDTDAQLFDMSALVDLILSQPLLGSTVKVDGNETDPYAFLTVLNLHEHREKQVIKDLTNYLLQKSSANPALSELHNLLASPSSAQIGLILTERLINIPAEIVPPMYTMLLEEIQWALEEKEPYNFSHYLVLSKTYTEVASKLDQEENRPQKKSKKGQANGATDIFYFHPEDEVLQKHALAYGAFDYTHQADEGAADSRRAFQDLGIRPQGHLIFLEGAKFEPSVNAVAEYLKP